MIRDEIHTALATQMAAKLDAEIKDSIDGFWGPSWSLDDFKRRCQFVGRVDDPVQTLYTDGVPILEIHPAQVERVRIGMGWELRATQNFRRLCLGAAKDNHESLFQPVP